MICFTLIFLNEFSEAVFGKSIIVDPEKLAVCGLYELATIDMLIGLWIVGK